MFHTSRPLASQIIDRSHLEALKYKDMVAYINHHLKIAGVNEQVLSDEATLAIHEGSGGLLRCAKFLTKGAPAWPPPMKNGKWSLRNTSESLTVNSYRHINPGKEIILPSG